jgi:hypothetical protein
MEYWVLEIEKYVFWLVVSEIVLMVIFLYVLYLLTKAGVRDGINESRLGKRLAPEKSWYEQSKDIRF